MERLVVACGHEKQRGQLIGRATRERIGLIRSARDAALQRYRMASLSEWLPTARKYLSPLWEYAPRTYAEMCGMADGAGLPFDDILLLTCIYEKGMNAAEPTAHCTSFAARGRATVNGGVLCGQTNDEDPANWANGDADIVVHHVAPDGLETLIYTHSGLPAYMGMNSAGLCMLWNSIDNRERAIGVPSCALIRETLFCTSLAEAEAYLRAVPHAVPNNFLLAHARDGLLNMEVTPSYISVVRSEENLCHANHILDADLSRQDAIVSIPNETTCHRMARMEELLMEYSGRIDVACAQRFVTDHGNFPVSICTHPRADWPFQTLAAMVFDPGRGAMHIAFGNGCTTPFECYGMACR
jgi:hypothetical protein